MSEKISRYVQIDNWIFEVKSLRAIKVNEYGKPYSAIANINLNGDSVYIDGLLTREEDEFSKDDYLAFKKVCKALGVSKVSFDRYKQDRLNQVEHPVDKVVKSKTPNLYLIKGQ